MQFVTHNENCNIYNVPRTIGDLQWLGISQLLNFMIQGLSSVQSIPLIDGGELENGCSSLVLGALGESFFLLYRPR
jgi:hypothetical protein